jgi:hypothetical protein
MINCKFVYKLESGGTSDSVTQMYAIDVVPRIGEKVSVGDTIFKVVDVIHHIDPALGAHEVTVYYGADA